VLKLTYVAKREIKQDLKRETNMRNEIQERLTQELSRKQFLQLMGSALLMVFGFNNLVTLLLGKKHGQNIFIQHGTEGLHGFGSSKFGT
jgi:hypothetical protein